MKSFKIKYILLTIFACLSLISVGFSSWIATNEISSDADGMIVIEDVMESNDYITCSSENITKFSFFKTGFVSSDGSISTTGTIEANLVVKVSNCKLKFISSDTLEVNLVFENDNFKLFKEEGMSYTVSVYNGSDSLSVVTTDNDTLCNSVFDITNFNDITSEEMTIKVIYTFNISDQTYFRDTVYPTLIDDDFNFALSAKLTGK